MDILFLKDVLIPCYLMLSLFTTLLDAFGLCAKVLYYCKFDITRTLFQASLKPASCLMADEDAS